jgi:hypothetical protein
MNSGPIFLAGPDRSGTTLIFALLASHPNISMVRRTNMFRYFYRRYGDLSQAENLDQCLSDMSRFNRMRHLSPDRARIRREFLEGKPDYGRLFALFHQHHAERAGKRRWGDKSLHSEHFASEIFTEFPDARIIHMTRDPRDRYASVSKRHGKSTSRLGPVTARWLNSMWAARRNQARFPDRYMVVRFEDLAGRPEESMRQICAFIGEEYSPALLGMEGATVHRDSGGNSSFGQLEPGAISTKPIGRFREVLSAADIAYIQMFAGTVMESYGYPRESVKMSLKEWARFFALIVPVHLVRMYGWLLVNAIQMRRTRVPQRRLLDKDSASLEDSQAHA